MLDKYAVLYPTLGANPFAKDQAPGKLFHQSLNEANWLVATAIAYDCVYDFLPAERGALETHLPPDGCLALGHHARSSTGSTITEHGRRPRSG